MRERIAARTGDASDADVAVYEATPWEPEGGRTTGVVHPRRTTTPGDPRHHLTSAEVRHGRHYASFGTRSAVV